MLNKGVKIGLNSNIDACLIKRIANLFLQLQREVFRMCYRLLSVKFNREQTFFLPYVDNGIAQLGKLAVCIFFVNVFSDVIDRITKQMLQYSTCVTFTSTIGSGDPHRFMIVRIIIGDRLYHILQDSIELVVGNKSLPFILALFLNVISRTHRAECYYIVVCHSSID